MATTASMGVLSSWPIMASRSDLALSAASAASRASRSSASPSTRPWICANRSSGRKSSGRMTTCPPLGFQSGRQDRRRSLKTRLNCLWRNRAKRQEKPGKSAMRRIRTKIDLKEGVAALVGSCGHLARVHALAGDPPLRRRPAGFKGLARVIVGQQLSIASAKAIWGRLEAQRAALHRRVVLYAAGEGLAPGRPIGRQDRHAAQACRRDRRAAPSTSTL